MVLDARLRHSDVWACRRRARSLTLRMTMQCWTAGGRLMRRRPRGGAVRLSLGLSSCQGCQALSGTVRGTVRPLSRPLSRFTVNTVKPLSGLCQVILTVTMCGSCQDCQAGLCQAVRAVRRCQGMPTPAGRAPRRVLGGQDWINVGGSWLPRGLGM